MGNPAPQGNVIGVDGRALVSAWRTHRLCDDLLHWADRFRWWLFAALLGVYLAGFNGQWRMQPDAALFLSLGRSLADGQGYTYLGQPHNLVYPGWPWVIAGTFKLFGTRSLVPIHVVTLLVAIATIALTYRLFVLHCGRPTAVMVTVGVGMTKTFFTFGFELWTDLPFTMGVVAFLAGWEAASPQRGRKAGVLRRARWYDWLLLLGGIAIARMMRPTVWPLLLAVGGAVTYGVLRGRLRNRLHLLGPRLAFAGVLGAMILLACLVLVRGARLQEIDGEYERFAWRQASQLGQTLSRAAVQHVGDLLLLAAPDALFQVRFGWTNALVGMLVVGLGMGLFRARVLWGLWFCALLGTIVLVLPLARYFLPVIPLLVFAWWRLLVWINHRLPLPWGNLAFAGLLVFAMGVNGSKVGGVIIQQHTRPFLEYYDRGEFAAVPSLAREIRDRIDNNAMVLIKAPYGRAVEFLSGRFVVSRFSPSVERVVLGELARRRVFVVEPIDRDVRALLDRQGLTVGPVIWSSDPTGPGSSRHRLSLHETRRGG